MSNMEESNNILMETPPSSPPTLSKASDTSDVDPPALAGTMSLSPEQITTSAQEAASPIRRRSSEVSVESSRGHIRHATPSTPIPEEAYAEPAPRSGVMPPLYSTPGRSIMMQGFQQGHHLTSDLTPVISNSNAIYVDNHLNSNQASRPGMPGLTAQGGVAAISPGRGSTALVGPRGSGRLSSQAAVALGCERGQGSPEDGDKSGDSNGSGSAVRGLRQRRSRMPLPRAGLPPAKRSSIEGNNVTNVAVPGTSTTASAGAGVAACILRMSSSNASSDSSLLRGDDLLISPSTAISTATETEGLGFLMGERLSMPSYGSLYSEDDESSVDTTSNVSNNNGQHGRDIASAVAVAKKASSSSIFKNAGLAPIELKPDRKFFSFQGASQYKHAVRSNDDVDGVSRLETIPSPSRCSTRPPKSPSKGGQQPSLLAMHHQQGEVTRLQYQPMFRSQHGAKEMADTKELDAIFKAPRQQHQQHWQQHPKVVSPYTPSSFAADEALQEGGSPMIVDHQQQEPHPLLSYSPKEEDEGNNNGVPSVDYIPPAYPVESKWSIPSIRLANRVNQSSLLDSHGLSYGDFSQYTEDDGGSLDESYYSFLNDDDDTASLSSRGSVDSSIRRRRISLVQLQQFQRMDSAQAEAAQAQENATFADVFSPPQPPAIAPSNSFLEKIQGMAIEHNATTATPANDAMKNRGNANATANDVFNPATAASPFIIPPPLPRRANNAFDSSAVPPPFVSVDAIPVADQHHRSSRRRQRRHRSSRRKEGAAAEWIQDLQSQSNVQLIVESASSKFMSHAVGGGGVEQLNAQDLTKALGMPHPLCRSSTIEAGPFTVHRGLFGQSGNQEGGVHLGSGNNSIALTSSGSGD